MSGDELDSMTNKQMYKHSEKMVSNHTQDIEIWVGSAMNRLDGLEGTFNSKFDGVNTSLTDLIGEFNRLLEKLHTRIPTLVLRGNTATRVGRVRREDTRASAASTAAPGVNAKLDDYETEVDNPPQPRGRRHQHPRNNLQQP